ncbi:AraC-like DNA-binding protein [Lachnotalea glycerini]|jgi:AraC-like DNA-binding protein|uniref:AraC family transcriptional regulator n=1 Tax=Lachnotalea glycerini TaxID=1763509 RepID=A0A255I8Z7_9FIRM|nr:AraC family transcriptional regulator [Lachnotalea glycerini]PXV86837.1 AraC-like DNA-binding protein [Lachnotalea glycerini]RDY29579.1 AraC family transcriptional regulator [Lachnotalea glycerini]
MATLYESFNDTYNHLPIKLYKHDLKGKFIWAPLHWHRSIEIFVAFEGRLIINVGSDNFDFSDDDWLIVNSSELHSSRYINLSDHFCGISILISLPFIETWIGKDLFFYNPHNLKVTQQIKKIAEEIYTHEIDSQYSLYLMKQLCELLLVVSKSCIKKDTPYHKPFHKNLAKVTEFLDYIEINYHENLTLNEIANYFKYSPSYFSRFFKETVGVNYYAYLNFVRVHHATQQLLDTHATLTECAAQNGFPNIKSFITTFKKLYGCTPKQFIKR